MAGRLDPAYGPDAGVLQCMRERKQGRTQFLHGFLLESQGGRSNAVSQIGEIALLAQRGGGAGLG